MSRRRPRRGASLILALVTLFVVSAAVGAVHGLLARDVASLRADETRAALVALDDAALAATLARLAVEPKAAGVPVARLGEGTYSSRVQPAGEGEVVVVTRAGLRGRAAGARAVVALGDEGPRVVRWERVPQGR